MTVLEASNKLFEYFSGNDILMQTPDGKDDISRALLTVSENPELERAAALCALRDFEKSEIVSRQDYPDENKTFWILKRPFSSLPQSIDIPSSLAMAIANFINQFCDAIEDKTDLCDASRVTSNDIKNLYLIGIHLANKLEKKTG